MQPNILPKVFQKVFQVKTRILNRFYLNIIQIKISDLLIGMIISYKFFTQCNYIQTVLKRKLCFKTTFLAPKIVSWPLGFKFYLVF